MTFRNHFLQAMEPDDQTALKPFMDERTLSQGESLIQAGDPPAVVAFPETAVLSSLIDVGTERAIEGLSTGVETGLGLLDAIQERPARLAQVARVAGSAIVIPADVFRRRVAGAQGLRSIVLDHVRAQGLFAQQLLVCPSVHRAPNRVARVLLETDDRSDGLFVLSQDLLAEVLTLQRTTVSHCMATFKRAGLVAYTRGKVSATNRRELEKQACSCYGAFRELYDLRSRGRAR